jgi:23S rRNA pseudouridine1911/1915/1917 synthase
LAGQFTVHSVERVYEAVVWGVPAPARGRIEGPIGRDPHHRLRMAVVRSGKRAITDYRLVAAACTRAARLEVRLMTGRTHQIRVHLTSRGNPIIGDRLYGRTNLPVLQPEVRRLVGGLDRIALHARDLAFDHPITGERLRFAQPAPDLFDRLLAALQD